VAKEKFIRNKPHVNVSVSQWLAGRGFSALGVYQVTRGLVVTSPRDRVLLAELLAGTNDGTTEHYFTIELRRGRVDS
jgi:hypothetical protein